MIKQNIQKLRQRMLNTGANVQALATRFHRNVKGMAAIETAFILPTMVVLYFGLVDVTDLMSANRKITITASTLADLVAQAPGEVTKSDLNGFFNAAGPIMDPYPVGDVGLEVYGYEIVNRSVRMAWKYNQGRSCGGAPASAAKMKTMMIDNNDLMVARVCYNYKPITGKVIGTASWKLSDVLMLRPRVSTKIVCKDC